MKNMDAITYPISKVGNAKMRAIILDAQNLKYIVQKIVGFIQHTLF